jgi:carbonic anhydrase
MEKIKINPESAPELIFEQMLANNQCYQQAASNDGDISAEIRQSTTEDGQTPYAVVVACSDSRVVPEHIFSAGIGELFTIRSAGNTVGAEALGSIEYAVGHLGVKLIIVMGHSHCGAVGAAMSHDENNETGALQGLITHIQANIAEDEDEAAAIRNNVAKEIENLSENLKITDKQPLIKGTIYDIETGAVEPLLSIPQR